MIRILLILALNAIIERSHGQVPGHIQYLIKYGYLETPEKGDLPVSFSDEEVHSALETAQKFAGIPETGKLDNETLNMLSAPRCGLPDTGSRAMRFATTFGWDKRTITYRITNYSSKISPHMVVFSIRDVFSKWAEISKLRFSPVSSNNADIKIGFFKRDHGDGPYNAFDGPGGVVGHAFFPKDGRVHFDDDEPWTANKNFAPAKTLLWNVAAHEIGHALGLRHTSAGGAVMRPLFSPVKPQTNLGYDDFLAIQSLYGT